MHNGTLTEDFNKLRKNKALLKKLIYTHQKEYQRKRLKAISLLWSGMSRYAVAKKLEVHYTTLTVWVRIMVEQGVKDGLSLLVAPIKRKQPQQLDTEKRGQLFTMITTEKPTDYGIDRYIWTADILSEVMHVKWNITLKDSRIYRILNEIGLSHQRAHRDYANADPIAQKDFIKQVKKNTRHWHPVSA